MHKAIHDKVCARAHTCMHTCAHTHTHTIITQIQMTKSVPIKDLPPYNLTNKNWSVSMVVWPKRKSDKRGSNA